MKNTLQRRRPTKAKVRETSKGEKDANRLIEIQ